MREGLKRLVILYARVSTNEQALSLDGQLRELWDHARKAGLEVVAAVEDRGEKRRTLDRPGIEEIMGYAEAGEVQEVWAWAWDRFGEYTTPEMLALELEEFGVTLRSLDDGGEGEDAEDMRVIRSLFSRREGRSRVRRSRRGMTDKALRGEVFGGFRARYGFEFVTALNSRGREVNVGYRVDEEKMAVVRRIFEMVAAGESIHAVQRELEQGGIPNPSGGPRWSRTTIRNVLQEDIYKPHAFEEVRELVGPQVAATLDPESSYGITWSGRRRSKFKSGRGKKRVVYESPREDWIAVPVDLTGSGLERATVEQAHKAVERNRSPAKVGDRFWELSGALFCAECGRRMIAYRRAKKTGYNYYYRCRTDTTTDDCPNRKSYPAYDLVFWAWHHFQQAMGSGRLLALFEEKTSDGADREEARRRRAVILERLETLARMRRGYQDQQAEGLMTVPELRERLEEISEEKAGLEDELRRAEESVTREDELGWKKEFLKQLIASTDSWAGPPLSSEERRKLYNRFGARIELGKDGRLTVRWEVELEHDSRCKQNAQIAQWTAGLW